VVVYKISEVLKRLAARRPVFHSEADFQHEFAWLLREENPSLNVRLEHPLSHGKNGAVDILCHHEENTIAFELKYLCQQLATPVGDEKFSLKSQGAQDIRRYDVFKDIVRMEQFVQGLPTARAAVIVLTNDPAYWTGPKRKDTCDAAFALREGRSASGVLDWSEKTGDGTKRGREQPIRLARQYNFIWQDYSQVTGRFGSFRFLYIPIAVA
jgi:hypothetical protein